MYVLQFLKPRANRSALRERGRGREGGRKGAREEGREGEREFWVAMSLFDFIDGWMGGYGMNTDLRYAVVFAPAAGFQARSLLV